MKLTNVGPVTIATYDGLVVYPESGVPVDLSEHVTDFGLVEKREPAPTGRLVVYLDPRVPYDTRIKVVETLCRELGAAPITFRSYKVKIPTTTPPDEVREIARLFADPHGLRWELRDA